jgi:acetate kinase
MADEGTDVPEDLSQARPVHLLVLNGGSSSIKFSSYRSPGAADAVEPICLVEGELSGIGGERAALKVSDQDGQTQIDAEDLEAAIEVILGAVARTSGQAPDAVGYRVVHPGPELHGHQRITPKVLEDLEKAIAFAPLHDPEALQLIRAAMMRYPDAAHYACFDTVFHETMPAEATTYPLPPEYAEHGVRRYGFHGLSCESIVRQMRAEGRVPHRMVIAHLGSGCSVTALVDGRSIDTTMGLTPTGGVVMGTRSGDLDPGLVLYLLRQQQGTSAEAATSIEHLLNHASGISSLSRMANDVKAVRVAAGKGDSRAQLALKVFTRSVRKATGGFCWLLGGLDAIVFAGGIGEHDAATRDEILANMSDLGVEIDVASHLREGDGIQRISASGSRTEVYVIPAQEDLMIALHVQRMVRSGT